MLAPPSIARYTYPRKHITGGFLSDSARKYGSEGGKLRAKRLTSEERSDIARAGALAKWKKRGIDAKTTPIAAYGSADQPLKIAGIEIPVYVLDDGRRVLVQRGLKGAIGMSMSGGSGGAHRVARFLESLAAKGIDVKDLAMRINEPIVFRIPSAGKAAYGYDATILPDLCDVIWEAHQHGVLLKQQSHIAMQAQILLRALAKTGIIALVDEVTGYQEHRKRHALAEILEKFVSKELRKWARRFPFDFYEKIFKLKGWDTSELTPNSPKPLEVGKITDDLIYKRLAPGVRDEIKKLTPRNEKGYLAHKLHQRLTDDVGHPKLDKHLGIVMALMDVSPDWTTFMSNMNRVLPPFGKNYELPLGVPVSTMPSAPVALAAGEPDAQ
jgi:hypothetical protein